MKVSGKFEVKLQPLDTYTEGIDGISLGRMSIEKIFHGELAATSKGEMLTATTSVEGSAGYVAIEQVKGTLSGHSGSFVLQHFGTMSQDHNFLLLEVVQKYQDRMMARMLAWAKTDNEHLRRLASEGCRPRLPWGMALPAFKANPSPILPILELLKQDESETVRRSVANNLNDISKDNPDVVLDVLRRWQADDTDEMRRLTTHALRTLLKAGNPDALALLGYPPPAIVVKNLAVVPETVPAGGSVAFSFDLESTAAETQDLMIDYVVYLMRANGKQTPKVFKLSKRTLQPGEQIHIERNINFKPVTTRKYYPGQHAVEPKINGQTFGRTEFVVGENNDVNL